MNTPDDKEIHLNEDVNFKGKINFINTLKNDGLIEGTINSEGTLLVSKTGQVKGEITVKDIESEGTINGNINAKGVVRLKSTAQMSGSLKANTLKVEEGVIFVGKCDVNPTQIDVKADIKIEVKK